MQAIQHHTLPHLVQVLLNNYLPEQLEHQLGDELLPHHTWILPQLVAQFRTWQILNDGLDTVKHNCKDPVNQVAWLLLRLPRSKLIPNQTRHPYWAQLTPLFLLAWRDTRTYNLWREYPGLQYLVEPLLWDHMQSQPPQLDREQLLELRQQACYTKTGKNAGTYRNPKSVAKPYHLKGTPLQQLSPLTQCCLLDLWIAHPDLRNQHQILNPYNWDYHPEPLIPDEVFAGAAPIAAAEGQSTTLPWK